MPRKLKTPIPLEKNVQRAVVDLYRRVGCWVEIRSQGYRAEAGGTRQTKGIPDLMVWPNNTVWIVSRPDEPRPWFHEVKRPGGKQTEEQAAYQWRCKQFGIGYVLGGVPEAMAHLRTLGLIR